MFFSNYLILQAVDSTYNRNEYQECFGSKVRPVRKADNLIAICVPIVNKM
jgi:hypothetical protein